MCGSWNDLELDHINPETKVSHNIWSWSEKRRIKELKKCQPLCFGCHKKKSSEYCSKLFTGMVQYKTRCLDKLQEKEVIRLFHTGNYSKRKIGRMFGVGNMTILRTLRRYGIFSSSSTGRASGCSP